MYPPPGPPSTGQSFRLGDHAGQRGANPGDYMARVTALEPATSKDGNPQLKITTHLLGAAQGQQHAWWYSLLPQALWRLFQDLIAAGVDPNFDPGPPDAARYAGTFAPALVNRAFQIRVTANGEYTNTKIVGPVQLGPDGNPVAFGPGPAPTAAPPQQYAPPVAPSAPAGAPSGWPPPAAVGVPTSPTGPGQGQPAANVPQAPQYGAPPAPMMAPGPPQPSPYAPPAGGAAVEHAQQPFQQYQPQPAGAPPTAYADVSGLFRQQ
jgi:hypothetical protein